MARELIRLDNKHISVDQMTMSVDRVLQCYIRNMFGPPSPLIENYLRERWRPETHTFHLPCGECTITLEGVHLQLGLPVDGYAVTGSASSTDWGAICYELLGAILDKLTEVGSRWDDLSRNLVHLRWLLKLVDFRTADELSWGSAVLATLYKEMCRATRLNKAKIGGCLSLLQLWAQFRFSFLRPRFDHSYTFSLITSQIEYCGNLDSDNRFPWHPRCLMRSTKSTYDNCIRIGLNSGHTISKCGKISMIYLLGNRSSFQS
ncbi:hypothetical protein CXB51_017473 [Gossypium anomalum]|uniref:Aminotransferase-like plant mobile domain-containing protein n=1 Tax=Gossypium anomalum TaxID=47600 RepID=A0A8J5YXP4_9ROSI|nr:hypothetical protein CXB51_017473 [Gossypium anomalum]